MNTTYLKLAIRFSFIVPEEIYSSIVLYDGVCGLCNRLNQFLLKRDREGRLGFASLQSGFAESILRNHKLDPSDLDTVYVVKNKGSKNEQVLARSDAIIHLVRELGGIWRLMGLARIVPRPLRDALYNFVAKNRYRVFGKSDSCMLPDPRHRERFIEI